MAFMTKAELESLRQKARERISPHTRLEDVLAYIDENYTSAITTDELSEVFASSKNYIFGLFKEAGLPPPMTVLYRKRVEHMRKSIEDDPYQPRLKVWRDVALFPSDKAYRRYTEYTGETIQTTFEKALKKAAKKSKQQSKEKEN